MKKLLLTGMLFPGISQHGNAAERSLLIPNQGVLDPGGTQLKGQSYMYHSITY